jgi:hypothetical protein
MGAALLAQRYLPETRNLSLLPEKNPKKHKILLDCFFRTGFQEYFVVTINFMACHKGHSIHTFAHFLQTISFKDEDAY